MLATWSRQPSNFRRSIWAGQIETARFRLNSCVSHPLSHTSMPIFSPASLLSPFASCRSHQTRKIISFQKASMNQPTGCAVPKLRWFLRSLCRLSVLLLGAALLAYMLLRADPGVVCKQVRTVGWGMCWILILGGFSQLIKTCAWRQTFLCDIHPLSWSRSFRAQVVSDAVGQLGFAGKLFGESLRISMLGPSVPLANGISSSAIDGALHAFTAVVVTVLGVTATLLITPLDGRRLIKTLLLAVFLIA